MNLQDARCNNKDKMIVITEMCTKQLLYRIFFIVAPCLLISSKYFIYQQLRLVSVLENIKIYIKTYIEIAPTCFGLRPSSGGLHMSLAKVTFIKSVKLTSLWTVRLCGSVLYQVRLRTPDDGQKGCPKHVE